jgi:hypothetical protein
LVRLQLRRLLLVVRVAWLLLCRQVLPYRAPVHLECALDLRQVLLRAREARGLSRRRHVRQVRTGRGAVRDTGRSRGRRGRSGRMVGMGDGIRRSCGRGGCSRRWSSRSVQLLLELIPLRSQRIFCAHPRIDLLLLLLRLVRLEAERCRHVSVVSVAVELCRA